MADTAPRSSVEAVSRSAHLHFQFPAKLLVVALLVVAGTAWAESGQGPVSARLRSLALGAQNRRGWAALRRYTQSTTREEARCLAYFTLGYREYEATAEEPVGEDLRRAAQSGCSLADFATYYEALADQQLHRDKEGIDALTSFPERYPESVLRLRAANLLAGLLVQNGHPEHALRVLQAESRASSNPASLLLLAKAYGEMPNELEAAKTYQEIYYAYPAAAEARDAELALSQLRIRMSSHYPEPPDKAKAERAERLLHSGQLAKALSDYDSLLLDEPRSAFQDQWRLGRARCLLGLRRYSQAIDALKPPLPQSAGLDATRLALLVYACERAGDESSLLGTLQQIYQRYPRTSSYADALAFAGGYFARQGFWQTAARYYQLLAQDFPENQYAPEDAWRVAWYNLLAGKAGDAEAALVAYLKDYPDSPRVPAALYWLGWLKDRQGLTAQARELYDLVEVRFANDYYAFEARHQLSQFRAADRAPAGTGSPRSVILSLGITLPPVATPVPEPCPTMAQDALPRSYTLLVALGLNDLAGQVLADVIATHPPDPQVFLALAQLFASKRDPSAALFAARRAIPNYDDYPFGELPKQVWAFLYPSAYWPIVRRYARADRLDPYLVMGLIRQESAFNPRATSSANARGLMQMMPGTAELHVRGWRRRRRVSRLLYSPSYNIRMSCRYLRSLLQSFNGDQGEALAAYNAGDFRVRQWLANGKIQQSDLFVESIPFTDTRLYVQSIIRDAAIYRSILTGRAKFKSCGERAERTGQSKPL